MVDPFESPSKADLDRMRRTLAPIDFNHTWSLLDAHDLSTDQRDEMFAAALAQRHNWYQVGTARNKAIADWQVSRVAAVLGYADLARHFGERSLAVAENHDLGPFVIGFAHEAIARAAAEVDDTATVTEHLELARAQVELITDEEERGVLEADLAEMAYL